MDRGYCFRQGEPARGRARRMARPAARALAASLPRLKLPSVADPALLSTLTHNLSVKLMN